MNLSDRAFTDRLEAATRKVTGHSAQRIETPGGSGRTSVRVVTSQGPVIATQRDIPGATEREAEVLRRMSTATDRVPRFLGIADGVLFQSDVGRRRLNIEIDRLTGAEQEALAVEAVASIFEMHAASRGLGLEKIAPPLGATRGWVAAMVGQLDILAKVGPAPPASTDRAAIADALMAAPVQFIKWDCRSGNAAVGDDGRLRWFDFEYAGLRHGAEDFAWLFADEVWPLPPAFMLEAFETAWDGTVPHKKEDYLSYLALYVTLHSVQRLAIILSSQSRKGWKDRTLVRQYDYAGVHPEFGVQLCDTAAFFADRNPLTRGLVRNFEAARAVFGDMQKMAAARRSGDQKN